MAVLALNVLFASPAEPRWKPSAPLPLAVFPVSVFDTVSCWKANPWFRLPLAVLSRSVLPLALERRNPAKPVLPLAVLPTSLLLFALTMLKPVLNPLATQFLTVTPVRLSSRTPALVPGA